MKDLLEEIKVMRESGNKTENELVEMKAKLEEKNKLAIEANNDAQYWHNTTEALKTSSLEAVKKMEDREKREEKNRKDLEEMKKQMADANQVMDRLQRCTDASIELSVAVSRQESVTQGENRKLKRMILQCEDKQ